jgi:dCMP deaminase
MPHKQEDYKKDRFGRPSWDSYYLSIAYLVSSRSIDPSTKHGAIIVSKENRVLSLGYNGPIKGLNDRVVPLTRPAKYYHMIHAEENALLAYYGSHQDILGATCYVTGPPCHKCLRMLIQKGIKRIVHGDVMSMMMDSPDKEAQEIMLSGQHVSIETHPSREVFGLLASLVLQADTKRCLADILISPAQKNPHGRRK